MSSKPKAPSSRLDSDLTDAELATLAIRAGHQRTPEGEHSEPIFPTSSFVFHSAAQAAARFGGDEDGNIYSRFTNPTVRLFEQRIAAMEEGERAVATSSGMAAILSLGMGLLSQGDHIVCSYSVFGSTVSLFTKYFSKAGIRTTFVDPSDLDAWRGALEPDTKLLFLETPSNPLAEIADIRAISEIAHQHGALLAVDNCFCTPALQKPLLLGADIVIHSATKFLDGQGRCIGGVVIGPDALMEEVFGFVRTGGTCLSPFNAWVFIKGLETLELRLKAQSAQAMELAQWLQQQPQIERVHYSGLDTHPQHQLAAQQQSAFGAVLAFEVKGGQEQAWSVIDGTRMISITGNLGDTKTTITHPATTTHGRLSDDERAQAGIKDNLIRVSVGLEALDDIRSDLQRGLAAL
ncbi:O-succinylhomoserine sulfhydrylase [Motiliproteus coralliicola]|uniref:O-succinylhomoserine sulfhydrylase n=1 Tax=Motiliproteus coralliicola TaxID=2283196 RepID=A0A369WS35_9GAMM|nr:O-succinylhomoserine sulfhydrylase [Motiliproteus coralliicola]RDE24477.1 O-succinylhomoserine sulfhydrylase [Motiliproteus coralliicola]